jgi:hypothetical protein
MPPHELRRRDRARPGDAGVQRAQVCAAYVATSGKGAEAARIAGYSDTGDAAEVRAHELLSRERVLAAFHEAAVKNLRGLNIWLCRSFNS